MRSSSARAHAVWLIGLLAYIVTAANRSSFGAVSTDAGERFDVSAGLLGSFAALQVALYALGQVPFGVALDRFGARRVLIAGMSLVTLGQLMLTFSTAISTALIARALVGFGDAGVFISVLRVLPEWFPARRVPMYTQLTSVLGQLGQIISAIPLVLLLHASGWAAAFLSLCGLSVAAIAAALAMFRDAPVPREPRAHLTPRQTLAAIAQTFLTPATRLGMYTHAMSASTVFTFSLMWGVPFATALGYDRAQASAALVLIPLVGTVAGPVIGALTGSYLTGRTRLALGLGGITLIGWILLLLPVHLPFWGFLLAVALIAIGNPTSSIGFEMVRAGTPAARQGLGSGFVNVGGFGLAFALMLGVGILLDAIAEHTGRALYDPVSFRTAMLLMPLGMALGAVGMLRTHWLEKRR